MEGNNYLTSGDLAMWDTARTGRNNYGSPVCYEGGYYHHRGSRGIAATGLALGAGGLAVAIFGGFAVAFGLNAASKARLRAAENASAGNAKAIDILAQASLAERQSRETWQNNHAPTISQYVDVRAGAGAGSNALATAEALSLLNNGNGVNSAIGGCNYLRVARVSGSKLCGCDSSCE